jgi:hypothetical protein
VKHSHLLQLNEQLNQLKKEILPKQALLQTYSDLPPVSNKSKSKTKNKTKHFSSSSNNF